MLFYLGSYLQSFFGPARLLQYFTVLIALALYSGLLLHIFFCQNSMIFFLMTVAENLLLLQKLQKESQLVQVQFL